MFKNTYHSKYKFNPLEKILIEYNSTTKYTQRGENLHTFANVSINKKTINSLKN